ncbi:MAG: bifunctional glutamate N-acetyltransferase/amino-acid acetyltransferase ArgJ [Desulfovibrio sp.]|nr:bifunctional glutamate N-acetyltransferase/amino-acid acetyltransferase ArgJ [Desulfovibrio sp.]
MANHDQSLPKGFRAGTAEAGFKTPNRPDLGLIISDTPCVYAGLFTQNRFCAAPVLACKEILAHGAPVFALLANSGQANACTGEEGIANVRTCQTAVAKYIAKEPSQVLVLSTGVIGAQLPMDKMLKALPNAVSSLGSKDAEGFTRAFMTTDAFPKYRALDLTLSHGTVHLTVMAKGAGMICPNMATMLCVCLTDADIAQKPWQKMFTRAVAKTFNRVSVDGDTSTNDSIIGLANAASGVQISDQDLPVFEQTLTSILGDVARMLVMDGEGAKKILEISVVGAKDDAYAEIVARSVGNSQLVKTAIYGGDANWGRIITAIGYSGADFDPESVTLTLCGILRFSHGQPQNDDCEDELTNRLKADSIPITISLGNGSGSFTLLASDLGHEYVSLNADYRS